LTAEEREKARAIAAGRHGGLLFEKTLARGETATGTFCVDYLFYRLIGEYFRLSSERLDATTGELVKNDRTRVDVADLPTLIRALVEAGAVFTPELHEEMRARALEVAASTEAPPKVEEAPKKIIGDMVPPVRDGSRTYTVRHAVAEDGTEFARLCVRTRGKKKDGPPRNLGEEAARAVGQQLIELANVIRSRRLERENGAPGPSEEGDHGLH
jgi:hypothetical protein